MRPTLLLSQCNQAVSVAEWSKALVLQIPPWVAGSSPVVIKTFKLIIHSFYNKIRLEKLFLTVIEKPHFFFSNEGMFLWFCATNTGTLIKIPKNILNGDSRNFLNIFNFLSILRNLESLHCK